MREIGLQGGGAVRFAKCNERAVNIMLLRFLLAVPELGQDLKYDHKSLSISANHARDARWGCPLQRLSNFFERCRTLSHQVSYRLWSIDAGFPTMSTSGRGAWSSAQVFAAAMANAKGKREDGCAVEIAQTKPQRIQYLSAACLWGGLA